MHRAAGWENEVLAECRAKIFKWGPHQAATFIETGMHINIWTPHYVMCIYELELFKGLA
jgi:hypothetical protein